VVATPEALLPWHRSHTGHGVPSVLLLPDYEHGGGGGGDGGDGGEEEASKRSSTLWLKITHQVFCLKRMEHYWLIESVTTRVLPQKFWTIKPRLFFYLVSLFLFVYFPHPFFSNVK